MLSLLKGFVGECLSCRILSIKLINLCWIYHKGTFIITYQINSVRIKFKAIPNRINRASVL